MGTTAQKIQAIQDSKAAIKSAIEAKGVSDVGDVLSEYAAKITSIPSGGGSKYGVSGDSILGDVDQNGVLQNPQAPFSFASTEIQSITTTTLQSRFQSLSNLTKVLLPNLKTISGNLSGSFQNCANLSQIDFSSLETIGANGLNVAFQGSQTMTSVSFPELTTANGANALHETFRSCQQLREAYFPKLQTASGGYVLDGTFRACWNLRKVVMPKLQGGIGSYMFGDCYALDIVDLSQTSSVVTLSNINAFSNCSPYYKVLVPASLYSTWITTGNWANATIQPHIVPEGSVLSLKFKANAAGSTIGIQSIGDAPSLDIVYSTDNGMNWSIYTVGSTLTLANIGDEILMRAGSTGNQSTASSSTAYNRFVMTGSISCERSVMFLLNARGEEPEEGLANYCFFGLFSGCQALQNMPELDAMKLGTNCYDSMFLNCSSIVETSLLPATTLAQGCYANMFYGCSSLERIRLSYDGDFSQNMFSDWVYGVSQQGTICYNGTDRSNIGTSAIPSGWEVAFTYLTFTAEQANSTISMSIGTDAPSVSLEYSTDNGETWDDFTAGSTTITLSNVGDNAIFRAKTKNIAMTKAGQSSAGYRFSLFGKIAASGSVVSLLDKYPDHVDYVPSYCFNRLFAAQTALVKAPDLPSEAVGRYGYHYMFAGSSITVAPELPATKLSQYCYSPMFTTCQLLTTAPSVLPCSNLPSNCYYDMFNSCPSLATAPELPATTLASGCYQSMFINCTSLDEIKIGYTGNFSTTYFNNWVSGVAASGTFYYNGSDTTRGSSAIPTGWTVQSF